MTQLEQARNNTTTPLIKNIADEEGISSAELLKLIRAGWAVIPLNNTKNLSRPCAVGYRLRTKINANLGTSTDKCNINTELEKLNVAVKCGADAVMDLSIAGDIPQIRRKIIEQSPVPVGTVPIYEIAVNAQNKCNDFIKFDSTGILEVLENQAKDGVDFFTIHAGVTKKSLKALAEQKRIMGIVSRGGAIISNWMRQNKKENPFYEYYDAILDIAYRYDVTLSLGDGLRPGSIFDATDKAQISELKILGDLAKRARKRNVQVMIEGPGHVPMNQIRKNMLLQKKICRNIPFYVLGPLVTDVAAGYDHINSAIGSAIAASHGADFLCYVTPAEHLRHPSVEDVKEGVIASRIAAHAADINKGLPKALEWDRRMSLARKSRDWKKQIELSIDPEKAEQYRKSSKPDLDDVCTMCGKFCSIKVSENSVLSSKD